MWRCLRAPWSAHSSNQCQIIIIIIIAVEDTAKYGVKTIISCRIKKLSSVLYRKIWRELHHHANIVVVRISVFQILMGGIGKNMESAEDDMNFKDGSVNIWKVKVDFVEV